MRIRDLIIHATAKPSEITAAKVLKHCIFLDTELVVGDDAKTKLPDIYSNDLTIGFEVVQMERDEDLDTKYIGEEIEGNNGDFVLTKKFCEERFPDKYRLTECNGKVFCITTNGMAHNIDWMKPIYERELTKKLTKLNMGHYGGIIGEINLCISIVHRAKRLYDAELITYCYKQIAPKYDIKFNNLYIIESDKIFVIHPDKIENITPKIWQNCICDFEITGEEYIEEIKMELGAILTL